MRVAQRCCKWLVLTIALGLASTDGLQGADNSQPELLPGLAPQRIEVFPASFSLASPRRVMHLAVTGFWADGVVQDLTQRAELTSTDPSVLQVEGGVVRPVADGNASVVVRVDGHEVAVHATVVNQGTTEPVSFQYETLVALTKQGCNSGACHGSPSGKGGFRLSLRAYDAVLDTETLIREAFNRRTNVYQPEESLLLQKPLMQVAHGGGRRLSADDPAYVVLRNWIAEGMHGDPADAAQCTGIEIYPPQRVLKYPATTQQIVVLAHFSDGSIRDVTDLADFSSSDEAVATVDAHGYVTGHDRGESAVLVRYLEHMQTSYLMFLREREGFEWNAPAAKNYIDELVFDKLKTMEILPSEVCSDDVFLRRVHFDLLGNLPQPEETQAFLASDDPQKRERLIDSLLQRDEFAEYWSLKWGDLLRVNSKKVTSEGVQKFYRWIVASVRDNMPYDEFVRELITASGSTFDNPAANYYRAAADTNDCIETTAQLFLGIRIQCAKCHNHPFERWTQDNYYGIGAFFHRVQRKASPQTNELVVWEGRGGEVVQPRTGQQMKPWLPLAGEAEVAPDADRRTALANWLVEAENPFFARAEVNRIWGHLLGRGIVEPVDDFRASNPPSNEALLAALADDFVQHSYDRKHIIRTILGSQTYQLSAQTNAFNDTDTKYFSHARTRLLSAEQLLDAICQVTGIPEKFAGLPAGTRATQLPSPDIDHPFLKVFGQPAREMACQCERSNDSNLSQALQMINGPLVHGKLIDGGNRLRTLVTAGESDENIVSQIYMAGLCRQPREEELAAAKRHIAAQEDRMLALEDVCWAVLNSKEFLFQH